MSDLSDPASFSPRWSMDSIYPGFSSAEFKAAKTRLGELASGLIAHLEKVSAHAAGGKAADFESWLVRALELNDEADTLSRTLSSFCYAVYSTDTGNKEAMTELYLVDEIALPFARASVLFLNIVAGNEKAVRLAIAGNPQVGRFAFYLEDALFWQKKQMGEREEDLAADLARSGADAWGRLQEQMTSTADCAWDDSENGRKSLVELRSLAFHKDGAIRKKAFEKELEICRNLALPLAAALNGVKGTAITLNRRRNWDSSLDKSVHQGRLSQKALDALILAIEESLPHWRRYLKAKARLLGQSVCSFSDLFAPVGGHFPEYTWDKIRSVIIARFTEFSPAMGDFAKKAFDLNWIDAESRKGKVNGAYCTDMPLQKETRILCNFDGTFNTLTTVAHELGHAFHAEVLKDLPGLQQNYPMTLAETASIFAETVVFNAELETAPAGARLGLLEAHLQDGCQVLVDILSRFYFERAVFEERKSGELSVDDFCRLMTDAQIKTYGDGLDPERLHPYMWLIKGHYYSSDLGFYNFPYAFGQLFALALYARSRTEGAAFASTYEEILLETGRMDAVELTSKAGVDIESPDFWRAGIGIFVSQIDEFEKLAGTHDI